MSKEKDYFAELTTRFVSILKNLKQQKSRFDDQQYEYEKSLTKEMEFALNRDLPITRNVDAYMQWVITCRLHDLTILYHYQQFFLEVADILEKIEPFYNQHKTELLAQKNPFNHIDTPPTKKKTRRLMSTKEKELQEKCRVPSCINRADKDGLCTDCFLKGLEIREEVKSGKKTR